MRPTTAMGENPTIAFYSALHPQTDMSGPFPADPPSTADPLGRRALGFGVIAAAHVAVLWGAMELASRPEVREPAREMFVRLIETQPPPVARAPEPLPQKVQPTRSAPVPQTPPPVMTAAPEAPAPAASFAVAPQPPAPPPIEAAPVPAAPLPVTAARFDAAYLSNPKPVYPAASRRLEEEGKVVLRVRVGADGLPLEVEVKTSSGFARLDEAAKAAVKQWRFVPGRRGDEAIESWVSVPVVFSLQGS